MYYESPTQKWEAEHQAELKQEYLDYLCRFIRYTNVRKVICEGCGKTFYTAVPSKKYCNWYDCGKKAYFKRKHDKALKKRENTVCGSCGKEFTPSRSGAKYCSNACRQKAHRDRNKDNDSNR